MNDRDSWTLDAMDKYGGGFVKKLADLARHADPDNLKAIKKTWANYWKTYTLLGIDLEKARK